MPYVRLTEMLPSAETEAVLDSFEVEMIDGLLNEASEAAAATAKSSASAAASSTSPVVVPRTASPHSSRMKPLSEKEFATLYGAGWKLFKKIGKIKQWSDFACACPLKATTKWRFSCGDAFSPDPPAHQDEAAGTPSTWANLRQYSGKKGWNELAECCSQFCSVHGIVALCPQARKNVAT